MSCATAMWAKILRENGAAGTHTYPSRTEVRCATAMWGKIGAKKVHRVPHLSVAQPSYLAPRLFWYPWRTYFRCATPKCAQVGRPGTSFAVAQDQKTCATGKLMCVAQYNMVRHVYLAMTHCFYCAPRLLGLPISLFLLVGNESLIPMIQHYKH